MKKLLCTAAFLIIIVLGFGFKNTYEQYKATHLPADIVVYYVPRHIYMHLKPDCPHLYGGLGRIAKQDTYGRMKNSKMSNELCPDCVPPQYIH